MNVFVSWSGCRTRVLAAALGRLLHSLQLGVNAWSSAQGITAGKLWRTELFKQLKRARIGIICVSRYSVKSEWVQFEIGALCTSLPDEHLFPYLVDIDADAVPDTLKDLQCCRANEEETWQLVGAIHRLVHDSEPDERCRTAFDDHWPALLATVHSTLEDQPRPLDRDQYNRLDKAGVEGLLKIHFDATAKRIQNVIAKSLDDVDGDVQSLQFDLLAPSLATTLQEGRHLLSPFHFKEIAPLGDVLDGMFPPDQLNARVRLGLELSSKCKSASQFMSMVDNLIRTEQADLLRELRVKLSGS